MRVAAFYEFPDILRNKLSCEHSSNSFREITSICLRIDSHQTDPAFRLRYCTHSLKLADVTKVISSSITMVSHEGWRKSLNRQEAL